MDQNPIKQIIRKVKIKVKTNTTVQDAPDNPVYFIFGVRSHTENECRIFGRILDKTEYPSGYALCSRLFLTLVRTRNIQEQTVTRYR